MSSVPANRASPTAAPTRTIMKAADRREALIDCAQELFFSAGYEPTTINDIIIKAGISKGGFYHHFAAKEDLLEAVVVRMTDTIIAQSEDILNDPALNALERLNRFVHRSSDWKVENAARLSAITKAMLAPENTVLFQRILAAVTTTLHPLMRRIVLGGVAEGVFNVPDPGLVAEIIISLTQARRQVIFNAITQAERGDLADATRLLESRMKAEAATIERLLGVKPGQLVLLPKGAARKLLAAMANPA